MTLEGGRSVADDDGRTRVAKLWAGGDCRAGGRDLTVEAVERSRLTAILNGSRNAHAASCSISGGKVAVSASRRSAARGRSSRWPETA